MLVNVRLYSYLYTLLLNLYATKRFPHHLIVTLALLLTGLILGRQVQLWEIALWAPLPIQLTSLVRRFERFLADPRVEPAVWFAPFVRSMHQTLGYEVAYLIIDCTRVGRACRSLVAGLAYHGSVLPMGWKTVKGNKGHVKGELQKALLAELAPALRYYQRIIVLGDGEFSNETVIRWLLAQGWEFVLRCRMSALCRLTPEGEWQSLKTLADASALQPGTVHHWEGADFTQAYAFPNLTLTLHWAADQAEPLPLVSNLPAFDAPHLLYDMRYWIETLFANFKSRGFHLAQTHLTDPQQLDRLLLLLAIAAYFFFGFGTTLVLAGQTHLVDRSDRRDLSLFQLGMRSFLRLLACGRFDLFSFCFTHSFHLPAPGFQSHPSHPSPLHPLQFHVGQ